MGNSNWNPSAYSNYTRSTATQSRSQRFSSSSMLEEFDPSKIKFREAVDSEANPESSPIILGCDVTGSMGQWAEEIVRHGLGTIMEALYTKKPIPNPQIMGAAIGDSYMDESPLQVTQFEADMKIVEQLTKLWLEGGGGGNGGESYALIWWFALYKCYTDTWHKRKRKGYIFTIGDECCLPVITKEQITKVFGVGCEVDINVSDLLDAVQAQWNVFHLIVNPVTYQPVQDRWRSLLNERAIMIQDPRHMAEGIVSLIQMVEGAHQDEILAGWTDPNVRQAVAPLLLAAR